MLEKYALSFTAASLRLPETVIVARCILEQNDLKEASRIVRTENLLGLRSVKSGHRIGGELMKRLETLSQDELRLFVFGSYPLQRVWAWIAICRTYSLIAEFMRDVVLPGFMIGRMKLENADFDRFVEGKVSTHPELLEVSEQTLGKLRQTLFKMLVEAEIVTKDKEIIPSALPPQILETVSHDDFVYFPMCVREAK